MSDKSKIEWTDASWNPANNKIIKIKTHATVARVSGFEKLDAVESAAKWAELDGAVESSIVSIAGNYAELATHLLLVRSFLSQRGNPARKAILDSAIGIPLDLTWSAYLKMVAARVNLSARTLQDKIAGLQLNLPDGKNGSSVARDKREAKKKEKQIPAGISQAQIAANAALKEANEKFGKAAAAGNEKAAAIIAEYEVAAGVSTENNTPTQHDPNLVSDAALLISILDQTWGAQIRDESENPPIQAELATANEVWDAFIEWVRDGNRLDFISGEIDRLNEQEATDRELHKLALKTAGLPPDLDDEPPLVAVPAKIEAKPYDGNCNPRILKQEDATVMKKGKPFLLKLGKTYKIRDYFCSADTAEDLVYKGRYTGDSMYTGHHFAGEYGTSIFIKDTPRGLGQILEAVTKAHTS